MIFSFFSTLILCHCFCRFLRYYNCERVLVRGLLGGVVRAIALVAEGTGFASLAGQMGHSVATAAVFLRICVQTLSRRNAEHLGASTLFLASAFIRNFLIT